MYKHRYASIERYNEYLYERRMQNNNWIVSATKWRWWRDKRSPGRKPHHQQRNERFLLGCICTMYSIFHRQRGRRRFWDSWGERNPRHAFSPSSFHKFTFSLTHFRHLLTFLFLAHSHHSLNPFPWPTLHSNRLSLTFNGPRVRVR
jgi:hypothetical protein